MMDILATIGGWGLLIILLLINVFIAWKVLSKKLIWAVVFIIGVAGSFVLAVLTEPNCGCLSEYTTFREVTRWFADLLDTVFWLTGNYFLIAMAGIAFVYWVRGRHPMASQYFWRIMFKLVVYFFWWKINFIWIKCLSCPMICDLEMSLDIIEECMIRNFW
ncbi:MAG: hypothetical protein AAF990_14090 [Bacteroidota bacterium]